MRLCPSTRLPVTTIQPFLFVSAPRRFPVSSFYFLLMSWLQLRFDYDIRQRSDYDVSRAPASIGRNSTRAKNEHVSFCPSRVGVVSQSNRTQIIISITSVAVECVVVSSCRNRIVVESQLWYRLKFTSYSDPVLYDRWMIIRREQQETNLDRYFK